MINTSLIHSILAQAPPAAGAAPAAPNPLLPAIGNLTFGSHAGFTDLPTFAMAFLNLILPFAGIIAVLAVCWAGILYITSGGDEEQAGKAKKNLTWAIIGVILIAFSQIIVTWVNQILTNRSI